MLFRSIVKRVLSKTTGQLLHANYDFEAQCYSAVSCTNFNSATESLLWSFRNAIVQNRLYEITYEPCDPNLELCCDQLSCQVPLRAMATASPQNDANMRKVEKGLNILEVISNIFSNASNTAVNAADLTDKIATESSTTGDMPTFAYFEISPNTGSYKLCKLEQSGECKLIDGRILLTDGGGYAEFEHNGGLEENMELQNFLYNFFMFDRQMHCNQTMTCGADNQCNIIMSCQAR